MPLKLLYCILIFSSINFCKASDILYNQVDSLLNANKYFEAEQLLLNSTNSSDEIESTVTNIFRVYYRKKYYFEAIEFLEKVKEPQLNPYSKEFVVKLNIWQGYSAEKLGLTRKTISFIEEAMKIAVDDTSLLKYQYQYIYVPLANNYATIGDLSKSIHYHNICLNYFVETNNYNEIARTCNNLSESYYINDELEKSENTIYKIFDLPKDSISINEFIKANIHLSTIYLTAEQPLKAIEFAEKGQQLLLKSKDAERFKKDLYLALAKAYASNYQLELASSYFKKTIAFSLEYYGKNHRELSKCYIEYADFLLGKKEYKMALGAYQKAINILTGFKNNTTETPTNSSKDIQFIVAISGKALALNQLYKIEKEDSYLKKSLEHINLIVELLATIRNELDFDDSKYTLSESFKDVIDIGIDINYELFQNTSDKNYLIEALYLVEQNKANVLLNAIKTNVVFNNDSTNLVQKKHQELIELKNFYTNQLYEAKLNKGDVKEIEKSILNLDIEIDKNSILHSSNKLLTQELDFTAQKESLTKNTTDLLRYYNTIIEYNWTDSFLYSFTITTDTSIFSRMVLDESFINTINDYMQSFQFESRHTFKAEAAQQLCEKLLPAVSVGESIQNVLIIPDGTLNSIPFEAFVDDDDKFIIENYNISYANSLNTLFSSRIKNNSKAKVLSIAPVFEENDYKHLAFSLKEQEQIENVVSTFGLVNKEATKQNFLNNNLGYSILHLSTHAKFDSIIGTSFIEFYDSKLFTEEIYNLVFNNNLVVLSACETALGKLQIGEGPLSLSRAFNYAGIPSTITSLWEVNETSTSIIIGSFYSYLSSNFSINYSLAQSKRDYLSNNDIPNKNKTPFYWAGLVHWGENQTLVLDKPTIFCKQKLWMVAISVFVLLIFGTLFWFKSRKRLKF